MQGLAAQMKKEVADYTSSLYQEGYLNDQFEQLKLVQNESNPRFVVEAVNIFFKDAEKLLNQVEEEMGKGNIDFPSVDASLHQLKGCSSCIGALRVLNAVLTFKKHCEEKNADKCLESLQELKHEYTTVKTKLEALFMMEQQIAVLSKVAPIRLK